MINFIFYCLGFFSLYYANVSIGTPGLYFLVALDTGSNLFWLPCECTKCRTYLTTRDNEKVFFFFLNILWLKIGLILEVDAGCYQLVHSFLFFFYSFGWIITVQMLHQRAFVCPAAALYASMQTNVLRTEVLVLTKRITRLKILHLLGTWYRTYCTWPPMIHNSNLLTRRLL